MQATPLTRFALLHCALALALASCGEDSASSNNSGGGGGQARGGAAGAGGASAGRAGAAGTTEGSGGSGAVPANANELTACRHYLMVACERLAACDPYYVGKCLDRLDLCPSRLFAGGSQWTVELAYSCAAEWAILPCEAVVRGEVPTCAARAGTKPVGAVCFSATQCESGLCNARSMEYPDLGCGTCIQPAERNGTCDVRRACPADQRCVYPGTTTGTCVDRNAEPTLAPGQLGARCGRDGPRCAEGLGCEITLVENEWDEPSVGTCQPLREIGQPCLPSFGSVGLCVPSGTCDSRPTGTCVALRAVGQSCGYPQCDASAYCDYDAVPSYECAARLGAGEPCKRYAPHGREDGGCSVPLECLCPDYDCDRAVCAEPREEGESCDGTTRVCVQGFTCRGGACAQSPTDLAQPFEAACAQ